MWVWDNSQKLAEISTAMGLLIAGIAACLGVWQFLRGQAVNRELSAKNLFASYELVAFENPSMANPSLSKFDYAKRTRNGSREEFERYEWFVSYVDTVCEEILFLARNDDWKSTLLSQLSYHEAYFRSEFYERSGYVSHVSPEVRLLLLEINPNLRKHGNG